MQLDPELEAEKAQWANRKYKAEKTWIFKRSGDGEIIFSNENQAWEMLNAKGNWQRRDFTLIGCSDFKEFERKINDGEKDLASLKEGLEKLRVEVRRYEDSYERMKFDLILDDTDERVVKVRAILDKKYKELEEMKQNVANFKGKIYEKARLEEMEIAKNNKELPGNQDIVTPRGRRQDIINSWGFRL